ncbi:MAG TPA: DUF1801 domain-containing protein [Candidatus Binatia bacterium]|jgi:hypothetical protein|nr:DUF1801 domain-containing protein [Candidatus Binatia bacterium]
MTADIRKYHASQKPAGKRMCDRLRSIIAKELPKAEAKVYHGSPAWFIDGNPVVGYAATKDGVRLLFWSGRSFKNSGLSPEGTFKAAEKRYADVKDIKAGAVRGWLRQAKRIQWDYKNIVKRKGKLVKLGTW